MEQHLMKNNSIKKQLLQIKEKITMLIKRMNYLSMDKQLMAKHSNSILFKWKDLKPVKANILATLLILKERAVIDKYLIFNIAIPTTLNP